MDNQHALETVNASVFSSDFRKPCYGSYCFAGIPGTILELLGANSVLPYSLPGSCTENLKTQPKAVVLLFIDAFGWEALERYSEKQELETVKWIRENALCSKMTSQFPSTTAAHVTTIHSGLPVASTGIYEWHHYCHQLDTMVTPLPFSSPLLKSGTSLIDAGIKPEDFIPHSELYPALNKASVSSHIFQSGNYIDSPYNSHIVSHCEKHPFSDWRVGLSEMADYLVESDEKSYLFYYFDGFDHACHQAGPGRKLADKSAEEFFAALEKNFLSPLRERGADSEDIAVLLTADHGQVSMDYRTTIYLDEELPQLEKMLKRNAKGELLCPSGSSRDYFLHVLEDEIAPAQAELSKLIAERAEIHPISKLLAEGVFSDGSVSEETIKKNLSELVILPKAGESVFWAGKDGRFKQNFLGHHGGLTPAEMDSMFLSLSI